MSIPFSNTHYRIPRGFANLLEGLTREVLREQPQDIPHFAARYFAELLKKREESGFDPAEWGAALEDRYYNNHSFQHPEVKTFTTRTEDVFYSAVDVQLSQDLSSSIQDKEEDEHKVNVLDFQHVIHCNYPYCQPSTQVSIPDFHPLVLVNIVESHPLEQLVEDSTLPANDEDVSDRRESAPFRDNSEDTLEPHHRPLSSHSVEMEHKQQEKSDTDNLLLEQSATVIQAAFRGHQARGGLRKLKEESGENSRLSPQEHSASNLTSEEAAPHQEKYQRVKEIGLHHEEDLEPHPAETPQDSTPSHGNNEETRPPTTEDVFGRETTLEAQGGQTQDLQDEKEEPKEDNPENLIIKHEAEDRDGQLSHDEEDKESNLPIKEDSEGHDIQQTHNKDEARKVNSDNKEDMEGEDMTQTQDHREDDNTDNRAIEDDGKEHDIHAHEPEGKTMKEAQGLEAAEGPSSTEEPHTSVTQEVQSHETKTTEGQQESADNQDNETEEQVEDNIEELADTTAKITGEQQEHREDPREENEAFRKQSEEALDIALDDPDANAAAAKIQAGFRGHMTRKKMKSGDKDVKYKEGKEGTSAQGEHD